MLRLLSALLIAAVVALGCSSADGGDDAANGDQANSSPVVDIATIETGQVTDFGPPPDYPDGPWSAETAARLGAIVAAMEVGADASVELQDVANSGDPRLGWALADMQRFIQQGESAMLLQATVGDLLNFEPDPARPWPSTVDHLIAWDIPVPPEYFTFKRNFYSRVDPRWEPLFSEVNDIDWRLVSWGGVLLDPRPSGSSEPCRCIPAIDDPAVTPADGGDWYPDDRVVFGLVVGDEARAYPKNIMEVHEMVNDTLGGRRIGMPYCTLCGAAQAYLTDELGPEFEQPVFRTSGLLIRSNKMMYELNTQSFVDTFRGNATSGPLAEAGVTFNQVAVVTTTWGEWKAAHPDTTIVAEDGGIGREYDLDPLKGRDDNGPIFPIGNVDPRLPVQEAVLGVISDDGTPVAFHVATAKEVLEAGEEIVIEGFRLELDGGGLTATRTDGEVAGSHQAFWFAWSQFRPTSKLWPHDFQTTE